MAAADACDSLTPKRGNAEVSLRTGEPLLRNDLPLTVIKRRRGRSEAVLMGKIEIRKQVRYETRIRTRRAPGGDGVCFWLQNVRVEVELMPVTIFIAEASKPGSCHYTATLRHELQHLEYEKAALEEALAGLRGTARGARRPGFARNEQEARRSARAVLSRWVKAALDEADAEARRGHERLDSPESARRERGRCDSS